MPPLSGAYRHFREVRGASRSTALLFCLGYALALLLLRLESPAWQAVIADRQRLYPHLANKRPTLGDPLRYLLQSLWLLLVRPVDRQRPASPVWLATRRRLRAAGQHLGRLAGGPGRALRRLCEQASRHAGLQRARRRLSGLDARRQRLVHLGVGLLASILALLGITAPFDLTAQLLFALLLWGLAMLLRNIPGRLVTLVLIVVSSIVSCRYLWWRYTSTLDWHSAFDLACGLILLAAESYSWLVLILGYIQTCWPLDRPPASLPEDPSAWPSVDLMIPTYNEDLSVVRTTVLAAKGLDWPQDRLRIYILDDGQRAAFRQFARELGVNYIIRADNRHAKAGNLNHALTCTDGELIAILDCDHIPVRSFLQATVGWFLRDPRMALVQTPHHFFSPDPFERNLDSFRRMPNEGELFYGLVQNGNDMWNAAFFCGSCAVLRRSAIEGIGGFAVETVTEDAHTALRLHRAGWHSAYIRLPQAAGLATESLSGHIAQRIRWARGMAQIFRLDNPLLGRGLSVFQRLCYVNAMLHFLAGLPRLVFLTAPLAFLLLHAYIIHAPALMILAYVLPHLVHASLTNARLQGPYRHSFWGEVYETVLAWYIARPTTVALLDPSKGKFNVTAKGGLMEDEQFDWHSARPNLLLALLNLAGLGMAAWRLCHGPAEELGTVILSALWVLYNLLIIGTAQAVAMEMRQVRKSHRVSVRLPAALRLASGHMLPCRLTDFSDASVGLVVPAATGLAADQRVTLILKRGSREFAFPARVSRAGTEHVGLRLEQLDPQQRIDFVQCTFARADLWLNRHEGFTTDRPLHSLLAILRLGGRGYGHLLRHLPTTWLGRPLRWLLSFCPRSPRSHSPVKLVIPGP